MNRLWLKVVNQLLTASKQTSKIDTSGAKHQGISNRGDEKMTQLLYFSDDCYACADGFPYFLQLMYVHLSTSEMDRLWYAVWKF